MRERTIASHFARAALGGARRRGYDYSSLLQQLGISPELLEELQNTARRAARAPLLISAAQGIGLDQLLEAIDAELGRADEVLTISVPATAGGLLAWLHENARVLARETSESGQTVCRVQIARAKKGRLFSRLHKDGLVAAASPAG